MDKNVSGGALGYHHFDLCRFGVSGGRILLRAGASCVQALKASGSKAGKRAKRGHRRRQTVPRGAERRSGKTKAHAGRRAVLTQRELRQVRDSFLRKS